MFEELRIIYWPDPRLKKVSEPVREFTPALRELAMRMLELMREARGVGLAAPQVGHNIQMFVMNAAKEGEPAGNKVYINPSLSDPDGGEETSEEGCLSLPNVNAQIARNKALKMRAQDLEGKWFEEVESGFVARVWQHEFDHLMGVLITDRMGLADKLKHRRVLKELEEQYEAANPRPRNKTRGAKSK
jgi:peptide deformylase